jgi:hypothetical protein
MSSNFKYTAGLNNVGSYQVSGMPYATGSIDCTAEVSKIEFPYVTRWIIVSNLDAARSLKIGFSDEGLRNQDYFFEIGKASGATIAAISPKMELKVTELYLSGADNVSVIAGLTTISKDRINNISTSGTNWSGSVGVG